MRLSYDAEWPLAAPWRLITLVAILVALPVLALGELSASDAHARIRAGELDALSIAARRAAASIDDRVQTIAGQVLAGSATPVSGRPTPLLLALERNDPAGLDSFASYLAAVLGDQVERVVVLDRAGRVVASESVTDPQLTSPQQFGADYAAQDPFTRVSEANPTFISGIYLTKSGRGGNFGGLANTPVIGVSALVRDSGGARVGVVVAEVNLHLLGNALTPLLGAADDVYLIGGDGRLVLRATHAFTPDSAFGRDLGGSAAVAAALGDVSQIAADDPLDGGARLVGIAPVATNRWRVLAVRSPAAIEREVDASLAQARATRVALVIVVLLGSALFGTTAGRALRQRRELAAALGEIEVKDRTLEVANAQLQEATAAKSRFLANMSHELRTPLNAIIGFSDVLLERMSGELSGTQAEYVSDILDAGRHQLALVNDILDLSKVEAGRMELELTTFPLAEVLATAVTLVREQAVRRGIALSLAVDPAVTRVVADQRKLKQIVVNLVANAVKFTPDGGAVAVSARHLGESIEIAVRDSGPGIAPADQARIFEEFAQARTKPATPEGTGLGLTLAQRFVALHGGRLWVESALGKGSTFTFTLPVRQLDDGLSGDVPAAEFARSQA